MFLPVATRSVLMLGLMFVGSAMLSDPAWAQHGGHGGGHGGGGHHYGGGHYGGGHGFGGFGHGFGYGLGHHYSPFYYGGYYGLGYGAYGYNSWPNSYTPRVYSYSATPTAPPPENVYDSTYGVATGATAAGLSYQRNAEASFRSHHYGEAIEWTKRAAKEMPRDGRLFLVLSQAHLAVGEYRDAAGAARLGMSLLPARDWGYVVENFRNYYHDTDYAAQVRRLRQFIAETPNHSDARFLLGYHWVFLGYSQPANRDAYFRAASRELSTAAELNPRDEWTTRLLGLVEAPRPAADETGTGAPRLYQEPPAPIGSSRSVDASVEYPPPQQFEKTGKPSGAGADGHTHPAGSK